MLKCLAESRAKRFREQQEGTVILQSTHSSSAVTALLKTLEIPAPKRILALER
jgi:hypothetical protein